MLIFGRIFRKTNIKLNKQNNGKFNHYHHQSSNHLGNRFNCCKEMNSNDSKQISSLIWSVLNASKKSRKEELDIIEGIIIQFAHEQRKVGRNQILNHFKSEIENLK